MFKSRADLLIAAGESIKMQEKAGIDPVFKLCGKKELFIQFGPWFNDKLEMYEFPLAVVEGKPVFVGDELWNVPNNFKFVARRQDILCNRIRIIDTDRCGWIEDCSWNPPKPKTVMVELPYEFVDQYARCIASTVLTDACKKALEESK